MELECSKNGCYNNHTISTYGTLEEGMYLNAKPKAILLRRKEVGLTQAEVAKRAGIGPMSLYRMEKAMYRVHPFRAKAVADVLGCKVEELFESAEKEVS